MLIALLATDFSSLTAQIPFSPEYFVADKSVA